MFFGDYHIYNGGTYLYNVPYYEAYTEAGIWVERGYTVEIDDERGYITIHK